MAFSCVLSRVADTTKSKGLVDTTVYRGISFFLSRAFNFTLHIYYVKKRSHEHCFSRIYIHNYVYVCVCQKMHASHIRMTFLDSAYRSASCIISPNKRIARCIFRAHKIVNLSLYNLSHRFIIYHPRIVLFAIGNPLVQSDTRPKSLTGGGGAS